MNINQHYIIKIEEHILQKFLIEIHFPFFYTLFWLYEIK